MIILRLILCLLAVGCGGRVPILVEAERDFDGKLTCAHLRGEMQANNNRLEELTGERQDKIPYNLGMLLVSPLFLDLNNTQQKEAKALAARNDRLIELMAEKDCESPTSPVEIEESRSEAGRV